MKTPPAPTLSEHLLKESERFVAYPATLYRTPGNVRVRERFEKIGKRLAEWRQTFAPRPQKEWDDDLMPSLVDQFYCRDLLREVPGMVERTRKLSQLTLSEIKDEQSFVYLREAANCYILGLPQAAIALSRAAVEARLRTALSKVFGKNAVSGARLYEIINDFAARGRPQLLSRKGRDLANKVRKAGDDVLHNEPAESETTALDVLEAARVVILELEGGGR